MNQLRSLFSLSIALIVPILIIGCGQNESPKAYVRPVKTITIGDQKALADRYFPGQAEAYEEVNLAFDVAGEIIERPVSKGDHVKKGTLLARLDPRDFQNLLDAARAERNRALAHRDRIQQALKANAVAKQELTDAQARLSEAEANMKIRQKALDDTHIFAPFDGVIAATFVEKFQRVAAKQEVMRLLDISQIKFTVNIPENIISLTPYVNNVTVIFDAFPEQKVSAHIKEVGREASATTRTYPVTLEMDQPEGVEILPGMAGRAYATVSNVEALISSGYDIPIDAVFEEKGKSYVWIINSAVMTVSKREVFPGPLTHLGIRIESGLSVGDVIATAGVHYLKEGQKVRFMETMRRETAS